jgi:hypothetical protein
LSILFIEKGHLDRGTVFPTPEDARKNGALSGRVTSVAIRYQALSKHPGYLERIDQQGNIVTGRFQSGQFIPLNESAA